LVQLSLVNDVPDAARDRRNVAREQLTDLGLRHPERLAFTANIDPQRFVRAVSEKASTVSSSSISRIGLSFSARKVRLALVAL